MQPTAFLNRRRSGILLPVLAAIALLTTSGCVFWRLQKFRSQLGNFAQHVAVTSDPEPVIEFLHPVLEPGDLVWLLDIPPSNEKSEGDIHRMTWTFIKRAAEPDHPPRLARIDCEVESSANRVRRVRLPERFNDVVSQDILEKAFTGSASGELDARERRTGWALDNNLDIPNRERFERLLGIPTGTSHTELHHVLDYDFDIEQEAAEKTGAKPDATGRLVFDAEDGRLVHAFVRVGALRIRITSQGGRNYRIRLERKL